MTSDVSASKDRRRLARDPAEYRAFADKLAGELASANVPGGALAIIEHNQLRFATGLGVKEAGGTDPVDADTAFRVASVTKTFTAALALELAGDGVVSLDAPLTRYVPELEIQPAQWLSRLTLRKLLSHTSGVPDHDEDQCDSVTGAAAAWFAAHPNLTLWTPPGRLYSYSNLGYALTGHVLARATGVPYRELMQARIFSRLGTSATTFDTTDATAGNHARGHAPGALYDPTTSSCPFTEPNGSLWASVHDVARLSEALLTFGDGALAPLTILRMRIPHTTTQVPPSTLYGLGLEMPVYRHTRLIGHTGGIDGYQSAMWLVPSHDFGVIVLVNANTYDPSLAAVRAMDTFLDLPTAPPTDWSTPPSDWQRYVGLYEETTTEGAFPAPWLYRKAIELEDGTLYMRDLATDERYVLEQLARDSFLIDFEGETGVVTFWRDHTGRAEYLTSREGALRRVP